MKNLLQGIFSLLVFLVVFFVYFNYNQHEVTDARWVFPTALSIVKEHNFTLNEYQPLIAQNNHYGIDSSKGNAYSAYPIGTSLFAVPFVWFAVTFLHEAPNSSVEHRIISGYDDNISQQLAALVAALASMFIFLAAFRKTKKYGLAVLAAVLFAFATPLWSTAGVALRQQGISALIFCVVIFIFSGKNEKWIGWCGLLLGYAFIVAPINFWIVLIVAVLVFRNHRKQFSTYLLSSGVVFAAFIFFSYHVYGKFFAPHYLPYSIDGDHLFPEALIGNLISPARGLFFFSPVLFFSLIPLVLSCRNWKTDENFYWTSCIIVFLLAASSIKGWWGGWCYGPCLMTSVLPFFTWFLILFFERAYAISVRRKALLSVAFTLAACISVFAHGRGALSKVPGTWNYSPNNINEHPERLWQLSDLQMLRGMSKPSEKNAKPEDFGITADYTTYDQMKFPATLYDEQLRLQLLPANFYKQPLQNTFSYRPATPDSFYATPEGVDIRLQPFGYSESKHFLFEYTYPASCNFSFTGDTSQIPVVAFPEECLSADSVRAKVLLRNHSDKKQTLYVRLFYQNTTYGFPVNDSISKSDSSYLDNFYGSSDVKKVEIAPQSESAVSIPYSIGPDPRHHLNRKNRWRISARSGNYEFMLLALPSANDPLLAAHPDLDHHNPFAEVKREKNWYGKDTYESHMAYVPSEHFKFVLVDDDFDGHNNLDLNHIYYAKDHVQKPLCDTCSGFFKNVISDQWTNDDFNKGLIAKAPYVKAEYGNRTSNAYFKDGIAYLKIPGSTEKNLQKTWGEILFEPSFKYGHVTVRAKFSQMFNPSGTPNGIIHNLWLYQRDYLSMKPDPQNPYHNLVNSIGTQPYEIDFEIWSSITRKQVWDDSALINYSIVDYMRDANVEPKPGQQNQFGNYIADRLNDRQINIPGKQFPKQFFNYYHLYEIYWTPTYVRYLLDGKEVAYITNKMAKIPDQEAYLWIGSPIYQDGTYYAQTQIPFLPYDLFDEIDWIRIE